MTDEPRGFSTCAVCAASRSPDVAATATALATWLERQQPVRRVSSPVRIADFERAIAAARADAAVPAGV